MEAPSDEVIADFWEWFGTVADRLASDISDPTILEQLDAHVSLLGSVSWEVGPGDQKPNRLVITPDGHRDALSITKRIVSKAPRLLQWEVSPSKRPKIWNHRFWIDSSNNEPICVDASTWKYVLFDYHDGTFDIVIAAPNLLPCDESRRVTAATIVLDGILGEEKRLQIIGSIEVLLQITDDASRDRVSAMSDLGTHISSIHHPKSHE